MCAEHRDEEAIFYAAIELKSADERSAYLRRICADDPELLARLEALLTVHASEHSALEAAAASLPMSLEAEPLTERPGTVIGRYKLLEKIGEGGMAVVYMADQEKLIRRKVALKIIKLGMDTKQVIARFEAERQALAMMDHPNIAKVLDAGATETGRPYFVMELVKGIPITEYCDKKELNMRERLALFIQVCNAIQHAHQKGIIHRDIKPSNVMVTQRNGTLVPKVIDFGIAKATTQRLTEKTLFTRYAHIIGTPAYMSPEQAEFGDLDIDTRTDIYSLGVLFYELLTGTTPFSEDELRKAGYIEMQRIIREQEPAKPSTKLSTMGEALTEVAEHRRTNPDALPKLVSGDLDWIVMKSLEKDRTRRYDTATELAADVERHLNSQPVLAAAPSASYRLRKFIRRHRTAVVAALLVLAALLIGLSVAAVGFVQARTQRDLAEGNLRLAMQALDEVYLSVAEKQLPQADYIEQEDRQLLQKALTFYEQFAAENRTSVESRYETAKAYLRVGEIRNMLGEHAEAEKAYRQAITLFKKLVADHPTVVEYQSDLVKALRGLSDVLSETGQIPQAEPYLREAVDIGGKLVADVPDLPECRYELSSAYRAMGLWLKETGSFEDAEKNLRQSVELSEKLTAECPDVHSYEGSLAENRHQLGHILEDTGRHLEAEKLYRQALASLDKLTAEFATEVKYQDDLSSTYRCLASILRETGRLPEAEQLYLQAKEHLDKLVTDFPSVPRYRANLAVNYKSLAALLQDTGQLQDAEDAYRRSMEILEKLAVDFPTVTSYQDNLASNYDSLGNILNHTGRLGEAEEARRRALEIREKLAAENPTLRKYRDGLAVSYHNLGQLLESTGRLKEAEEGFQRSREIYEKLVADFPTVIKYRTELATNYSTLGNYLRVTGRLDEAEESFRRALEIRNKLLSESPTVVEYQLGVADMFHELGLLLQSTGRLQEAEEGIQRSREIFEKLAADFPAVIRYRVELATSYSTQGGILMNTGRLDEAEESFRRSMEIKEQLISENPSVPRYRMDLVATSSCFGALLDKTKQLNEAEKVYRRAVEIAEQLVSHVPTVAHYWEGLSVMYNNLGWMLYEANRLNEAEDAYRRSYEITKQLAAENPSMVSYRASLGVLSSNFGGLLKAANQVGEAEEVYRKGLEVTEKLVSENPSVAYYRLILHLIHSNLGLLLKQTGRPQEAEEAFRRAMAIGEKLIDENPSNDAYQAQEVNLRRLGRMLEEADKPEEAAECYLRALNHCEKLVADSPNVPLYQDITLLCRKNINRLAWYLSTCADPNCRDPVRAVELAERVVEGAPENATFWNTLGVAHYRTGQWQDAVEALQNSMELGLGGSSSKFFFLAIAHWQLGHEREACQWYDQAVGRTKLYNEELQGLLTEAAELLGPAVRKPWATVPQPANGADLDVTLGGELRWISGLDATAHNVYFGTDPENLTLLGQVEDARYAELSELERLTWYCWRVDTVKSDGSVVTGKLWGFSTGNMIGWWKFDQTDDGTVIDSSGNGLNGKLVGDAIVISDAERGNVLSLDGDGDCVDCGNDRAFDITGPITVACWIKVNKFDKNWQTIVAKGDSAWRVSRTRGTESLTFGWGWDTGLEVVRGTVDVNDGKWHQVAGVYDGKAICLYVDGALDNSAEATGAVDTNNEPVFIGENSEAPGRHWSGLLDDLRIYSYALSEAEVAALYAGNGPGPLKRPKWLMDKVNTDEKSSSGPGEAGPALGSSNAPTPNGKEVVRMENN